jgi:hypothetical protein
MPNAIVATTYHAVLLQEAALVASARGRVHAGVVGQGRDAMAVEEDRGFLDLAPRQAVNDPRLAAMVLEEVEQLFA